MREQAARRTRVSYGVRLSRAPRDSSKWWACSQANCFSDTLSSWKIVVQSVGPNVGQRRERT